MKLNELKIVCENSVNTTNPTFIREWMEDFTSVTGNDWSMTSTHPIKVNVTGDLVIRDHCEKLEVQFDYVKGDFLSGQGLASVVGCPSVVDGSFDCSNNTKLRIDAPLPRCSTFDFQGCTGIKTIKEVMSNLTDTVDHLILDYTGLTSLEGIADDTKVIVKKLNFSQDEWTTGGLGVLLIKGLQQFEPGGFVPDVSPPPPWEKAQAIIQKYIGNPHAIFDCQSELIEAGLDEYAKL